MTSSSPRTWRKVRPGSLVMWQKSSSQRLHPLRSLADVGIGQARGVALSQVKPQVLALGDKLQVLPKRKGGTEADLADKTCHVIAAVPAYVNELQSSMNKGAVLSLDMSAFWTLSEPTTGKGG